MTNITEIFKNARVEYRTAPGTGRLVRRGTVTMVTKATITIEPDAGATLIKLYATRTGRVDVRLLSAAEVDVERWLEMEPTTELLHVVLPRHRSDAARYYIEESAVRSTSVAAILEQIEEEARTLRVWANLRPDEDGQVS